MNRLELNNLLKVLMKIKNPDAYVMECIHTINRDLARMDKMADENRKSNQEGYEIPW